MQSSSTQRRCLLQTATLQCLQAWRHLHARQQQRRAAALAARRRIDLGQLRRCLHAWRGQCGRHEARAALLQRAAARLQHGLMQRCWREWRRLVALRAWKLQVDARDQQIQLLGQQVGEHAPPSDCLQGAEGV